MELCCGILFAVFGNQQIEFGIAEQTLNSSVMTPGHIFFRSIDQYCISAGSSNCPRRMFHGDVINQFLQFVNRNIVKANNGNSGICIAVKEGF